MVFPCGIYSASAHLQCSSEMATIHHYMISAKLQALTGRFPKCSLKINGIFQLKVKISLATCSLHSRDPGIRILFDTEISIDLRLLFACLTRKGLLSSHSWKPARGTVWQLIRILQRRNSRVRFNNKKYKRHSVQHRAKDKSLHGKGNFKLHAADWMKK